MLFRFDRFELDEERYELRLLPPGNAEGPAEPIELQPKVMEVLLHLVRHADRTLTKDELLDAVWGDVAITEASLTRCISLARRALGEPEAEPRIVQTVRGRGYRIGVPVARSDPAEPATPTEPSAPPAGAGSPRRRWPGVAAGVALVLTMAVLWLARPFEPTLAGSIAPPQPPHRPTAVAVLAFGDLREASRRSVEADAVALAVIDGLARWPELEVTSHRSSFRYAPGANIDTADIGRQLGVGTLVTGTLRADPGGAVRAQVELVEAESGFQRWGRTFAAPGERFAGMQREIADAVVAAIGAEVDATHPFKRASEGAAASRLLLEGRDALVASNRRSLIATVEKYERALELNPDLIRGYVALSETYHLLWERDREFRATGENWLPAAEATVLEALERAPEDPEALTMFGTVRTSQRDWSEAEAALRLALAHRGGAFASHRLGVLLLMRGRIEEARPHVERALRLDPLSGDIVRGAGRFHLYAGEPERAVASLQRALEINPGDLWAPRLLAHAYELLGEHGAAREAVVRNFPGAIRPLARLLDRVLGTERSLRALVQLDVLRSGRRCRNDAHGTALAWAYLGDRERALECLERASAHHLWYVVSEPLFRPFHDDAAFRALVDDAGFTPAGGWQTEH